jgi:hypothetical protein
LSVVAMSLALENNTEDDKNGGLLMSFAWAVNVEPAVFEHRIEEEEEEGAYAVTNALDRTEDQEVRLDAKSIMQARQRLNSLDLMVKSRGEI